MQRFGRFSVRVLQAVLVFVGVIYAYRANFAASTETDGSRTDGLWRVQESSPLWARSLLGVEPEWEGLAWYVGDWLLYLGIIGAILYLNVLAERIFSAKKIFISYRRSDTKFDALDLRAELGFVFGRRQVFLDESSIPPGQDFPSHIKAIIPTCRALLLLVGPKFDVKRLHDPNDYVRMELQTARRHAVTIIPLLVSHARPLAAADLPEDLRWLATLNAGTFFAPRDGDVGTTKFFMNPIVEAIKRAGSM